MAARTQNSKHRNRNFHHFSSVLSSALLEWSLMFLLFINGLFSYLITKFATLSKLQSPCLLCSRLDHVISKANPSFYHDLLCDPHKSEVSNWGFCSIHKQLADVQRMCESCLFSFATEKKTNSETYRSLVGKIGIGFGESENLFANGGVTDASEEPLLKKEENSNSNSNSTSTKICSCCFEPIKQTKSNAFTLIRELSGGDGISRNHKVIMDNSVEEPLGLQLGLGLGQGDGDGLSHVVYSELKTSDSDSEIQLPDKEEIDAPVNDISNNLLDNISEDKERETINPSSSSPVMHESKLYDGKSNDKENEKNPSFEFMHEDHLDDSNVKGDIEISCVAHDTVPSNEDSSKDMDPTEINPNSNPNPNPNPNPPNENMTLSDAYEIAIGNKSTLPCPKFEDVIMGKDSSRVYEELKLLISQISAARGVDSPWTDIGLSPRFQPGPGDEPVLYNITKTLSLERNESLSLESIDGCSIVSEIEGESLVDRLKRQVDLDRKSISLLYKELEEERNASAIAANQAMAMITRLQEEKAAVHMEALQYQRLMEEQAEYDQEAISQKEKEIQELKEIVRNFEEKEEILNLSENLGAKIGSLLGFEEQKAFISDRLSELERKLHLFSNNSSKLDDKEEEFENESGEKTEYGGVNGECFRERELDLKGRNLGDLGEEIGRVKDRLKQLEADHNFLEHSLNSLRNGDEGARFIRGIARFLQELRDLGITHGMREKK